MGGWVENIEMPTGAYGRKCCNGWRFWFSFDPTQFQFLQPLHRKVNNLQLNTKSQLFPKKTTSFSFYVTVTDHTQPILKKGVRDICDSKKSTDIGPIHILSTDDITLIPPPPANSHDTNSNYI